VAGAIADYYMYGSSGNMYVQPSRQSVDSQQLKKVTEDMVVTKINMIFDEIKGDNDEFEQSYQGLKKNSSAIINSSKSNDFQESSIEKSGKKVRVVEDSSKVFSQNVTG